MTTMKKPGTTATIVLVMTMAYLCLHSRNTTLNPQQSLHGRALSFLDPRTVEVKPDGDPVLVQVHEDDDNDNDSGKNLEQKRNKMSFDLPEWAASWCMPPKMPRVDFNQCNHSDLVYAIPFTGGLTNALKMVLLGSFVAMEEGRCFFVDESKSHLRKRDDPSQEFESFWDHYFQPIGLPLDSPTVQNAIQENRVHRMIIKEDIMTTPHRRRVHGDLTTLPFLDYHDMDGHDLKRVMIKRMWRLLPRFREHACRELDKHYQLHGDFIAFSVRRGDKKTVEHFEYADPNDYLLEAQNDQVLQQFKNGQVPKIFVATDDCTVMEEFREKRPHWTFVSECDRITEEGFALADVHEWSIADTDAHFQKFFIELYAMALSKVYIGVHTTNVAFWAYFMRDHPGLFRLLGLGDNTMDRVNGW